MKKLIGKSKFNVLVAVVYGGIVGFLRGSLSEKNSGKIYAINYYIIQIVSRILCVYKGYRF